MSTASKFRLLEVFEKIFRKGPYLHRDSSLGNLIAAQVYEDLYGLAKSRKLVERVDDKRCGINVSGGLTGITARRADGTFGERNPSVAAVDEPGYSVLRSHLALIEIGVEVKILMKAMIKQIDRVIGDMRKQVGEFHKGGGVPISVGFVGINFAEQTTSYEGERMNPTDGKKHKHPIQEAAKAKVRLEQHVRPAFDEFLFLEFKASNVEPFAFEWLHPTSTLREYAAVLTRISRKYDQKF